MPEKSAQTSAQILDFPENIESYFNQLPASLAGLFNTYLRLENDMDRCAAIKSDAEAEKIISHLIGVQSRVLSLATRLKARSTEDIYFKLAFWVIASPEVHHPTDELKGAEQIAYSAFRDVAKMVGKSDTNKDEEWLAGGKKNCTCASN